MKLFDYQLEAVHKMKNGCILCGDVGTGKSLTSLAYYWLQMGGDERFLNGERSFKRMQNPIDLYIITTARKRDDLEWEQELSNFAMSVHEESNGYSNKIIVDSWNNINKYVNVHNSFFIFDEQRVVGYGTWAKSFIKIARQNRWILLTATPGDRWEDYTAVFIANGFYKHKTDYEQQHMIFVPNVKWKQVYKYMNEGRLIRLRNSILISMKSQKETITHHEDIYVSYDKNRYTDVVKNRWNVFTGEPIKNSSEWCQCLRRIVNSDNHRQMMLLELIEDHPKVIIFYNYDYELDILKGLFEAIEGIDVAEYNGHKHQPIPESNSWVYLVQYTAGAEGWNCIKTDTIIFYSQNYSYKIMHQSAGRIDRLNTPYHDLYYYHLKSRSGIDLAITQALTKKKKFNEQQFAEKRLNKHIDIYGNVNKNSPLYQDIEKEKNYNDTL